VDWEWTGVGAGEVDLAALTEGWSAELTEASERMYADVRWLGVPPRDHAWRLDAARIYMHLRWLGDRTDRLGARELPERLEDLQRIARRIGML
jgi:thiamine kinase-like enzyme